VALDQADQVCLLRQYRYATGGWLWELPAGKIDDEEPPAQTARRELEEEAGREAADWRELGCMHSSPGIFTEVVYLYLARDLDPRRAWPRTGGGDRGALAAPEPGPGLVSRWYDFRCQDLDRSLSRPGPAGWSVAAEL
jgi:8-oxo-dGTP pyrophosphatase MutT (NUDIX family)